MRLAFVCAMLLIPFTQVAAAGPPIDTAAPVVPVLTLTIQPPIVKLNSEINSTVLAQFNGTATVDKLPMVRCVVTLSSSTDIGWVSEISPTTMVFTSGTPQSYAVSVIVPAGTPTLQGKLIVQGRAVAAGLQSLAEGTAIVDVKGSPLLNATAQNQTKANATRAAGAFAGGGSNILTVSAVAAILVAVPVSAYVIYRRRRQRSPEPEA
jgi:hypothetical protein